MIKKVNWDKPIFAVFTKADPILCKQIMREIEGHTVVWIPNPNEEGEGISVTVDDHGYSVKTGKHIISN